jgi:ABC-2 type transport system ATP-binding protein
LKHLIIVPETTIQVEKLVKAYTGVTAVNEVTFSVKKGEIVGFLGPNGAGKSTTMRILTGFVSATSGQATVCGHCVATESHHIRRLIGYMPENNPLPDEMRVREYLRLRGKLKGLHGRRLKARMDESLEMCDLTRASSRIIGTLSKGYRQRVGIADAIIAEPEVIIMDEPTIGLDPHQIVLIRDLIASLRGRMSIIISSHILPEIEMTCDHVVIINSGRIVAADTPENLRREFVNRNTYQVEFKGSAKRLADALAAASLDLTIEGHGNETADGYRTTTLTCPGENDVGELLLSCLIRQPEFSLRSVHRLKPTLEQVFMAATRRSWEVLMPTTPGPKKNG